MISYLDHLRTQARLLFDTDLKRVWPQVKEKAGKPRLYIQFKVLQCERLSGAAIKKRYQWPADPPIYIKALKDMDHYISVLVLLTKTYTGCEYACVKGVFDLSGDPVVLMKAQVFSPETLRSLDFWHHTPETRWSSRKDMIADLAERVRKVVAAEETWLRKIGSEGDSIRLARTRELLSGLEAGKEDKNLAPLLHAFEATMFGREDQIGGLESEGLLPADFAAGTYDLVLRLMR